MYKIFGNGNAMTKLEKAGRPELFVGVEIKRADDKEERHFDDKNFFLVDAMKYLNNDVVLKPVIVRVANNEVREFHIPGNFIPEPHDTYFEEIEVSNDEILVRANKNRFINFYNCLVYSEAMKREMILAIDKYFGANGIDEWERESKRKITQNQNALMYLVKEFGKDFHWAHKYGYKYYISGEEEYVDIYEINQNNLYMHLFQLPRIWNKMPREGDNYWTVEAANHPLEYVYFSGAIDNGIVFKLHAGTYYQGNRHEVHWKIEDAPFKRPIDFNSSITSLTYLFELVIQ